MPNTLNTQLLVIGGGPGGYAAAFRAADLGLDVTLVDDHPKLGGVCLHRGCIPSKALLHIARLLLEARDAGEAGIKFRRPTIDLDTLRAHKDAGVDRIASGVQELARLRKVRAVVGRAEFISDTEVKVDGGDYSSVRFERCIIASGSRPISLPGLAPISPRIWDSTEALQLPFIPRKLLVIGGGYIGLELGTVYAALGSKVTVVELTGGLLPGADRDLVEPVAGRAEELFAKVALETKVTGAEETEDQVRVELESGKRRRTATFDRVLVAVGRQPNTDYLGLDNTAVQTDDRGFIVVDEKLRTTSSAIYAIGDVAGQPMLAHKAAREAKVAAETIAGLPAAMDPRAIPAVVFTIPEVAWCGLTETEAERNEHPVKVARFPWVSSGRAIAQAATEGQTKLLLDPDSDRILGAGAVGEGASEFIAEAALAIEMGAVAEDLALTIHPHPTFSETLMECAEVAVDACIHRFTPRRTAPKTSSE